MRTLKIFESEMIDYASMFEHNGDRHFIRNLEESGFEYNEADTILDRTIDYIDNNDMTNIIPLSDESHLFGVGIKLSKLCRAKGLKFIGFDVSQFSDELLDAVMQDDFNVSTLLNEYIKNEFGFTVDIDSIIEGVDYYIHDNTFYEIEFFVPNRKAVISIILIKYNLSRRDIRAILNPSFKTGKKVYDSLFDNAIIDNEYNETMSFTPMFKRFVRNIDL